MIRSSLAPGFMDRLYKICKDKGISLEQLAEIAQIEPDMFQYYALGEIQLDDITLQKILDYGEVDWLWLEHGYEIDPVVESHKKMGVMYIC